MATRPVKERTAGPKASAGKAEKDIAGPISGDGPMDSVIGYMLRRAQVSTFQDFTRRFKGIDLRPAEFAVLKILNERAGLKHAEVARMLGVKRTNFVSLMDSLERRGLATRGRSESDRRSHALYLTDEGRKLLAKALKINEKHEAALVEQLGGAKERELLLLLLSRLVTE